MVLAAEWGTGQVFWSMLWFFLWIIWFWLLIMVFTDIFRSRDLSGWGKALWSVFVIVLPYLGVFIYLIARGHRMSESAQEVAQQQDAAFRQYVQDAAKTPSPADELAKLAKLREDGTINDSAVRTAQGAGSRFYVVPGTPRAPIRPWTLLRVIRNDRHWKITCSTDRREEIARQTVEPRGRVMGAQPSPPPLPGTAAVAAVPQQCDRFMTASPVS